LRLHAHLLAQLLLLLLLLLLLHLLWRLLLLRLLHLRLLHAGLLESGWHPVGGQVAVKRRGHCVAGHGLGALGLRHTLCRELRVLRRHVGCSAHL
jgi:hypothetical protein